MTVIAIVEHAHCGTTMVAGIYEILGVPMVGSEFDAEKWEDSEMVAALKDETRFVGAVRDRCLRYRNWGFKSPGAWLRAEWLQKYLPDPLYLAIYKDAVSVTYRRFGHLSALALENTVEQFRESIYGIRMCGLPVTWLSYERAIVSPAAFVRDLADLAHLLPTQEQLRRAAAFIRPNRSGERGAYPEVERWL